jgi:hypothetical protein
VMLTSLTIRWQPPRAAVSFLARRTNRATEDNG